MCSCARQRKRYGVATTMLVLSTTELIRAGEARSKRAFEERNRLRETRTEQCAAAAEYLAAQEEAAATKKESFEARRARARRESAEWSRQRAKKMSRQHKKVPAEKREDLSILSIEQRTQLARREETRRQLELEETLLESSKKKTFSPPPVTVSSTRPDLFQLPRTCAESGGPEDDEETFYKDTAEARCALLKQRLSEKVVH